MPTRVPSITVCLALALAACSKGEAEKSKPSTATVSGTGRPPPAQVAPRPPTAAPSAVPAAAPPAATEASAKASAEPEAAPGPGGRTAVPTTAEWDAAKEVTVTGSTKLGCETKMVREWLRVSCRKNKKKDPDPESVEVVKGGKKVETFTFTGKDVASLVVPFVEGTDIEAVFKWKGKKSKLVIQWPKGAPKPQAMGAFKD